MKLLEHFMLLADYNRQMNGQLYDAAARLDDAALVAERGAFFGSILGTLNHIAVGDRIWLQRFATHPSSTDVLQPVADLPRPESLAQTLFTDLESWREHRRWLDACICEWVAQLTEPALADVLEYRNTQGVASTRCFSALILHFFNHQTHHRGQATTLLSQAGEDVGVTDLLALIPRLG